MHIVAAKGFSIPHMEREKLSHQHTNKKRINSGSHNGKTVKNEPSNMNQPTAIYGDNLPRHIIRFGKKSHCFCYIIRSTNAFQASTIKDF